MAAVAETMLAQGATPAAGGERYQIVVHVDAAALTDDHAPGRCGLDDGPALPGPTARRLACDASVVAMTERDGRPLSVGRRTRSIPPAIRRALRSRRTITAAASPAAPRNVSSTPTTSTTGPTAAKPS